ncbi:MAG: hypothetical protein H6737_24420 [Alphaproteobacteria bacterium]|nr:hypothetical protein [Alphaproteobacteria bacterium]
MLLLLLTGCLAVRDDSPTAVFDYVWSDFDALYGGFAYRDVDWDDVYDRWRPQVTETSTDDALFDALSGMLAELDDGHVRLVAPDHALFDSSRVYRDGLMEGTFDEEVVRTYLTNPDTGPWDWYLWGTVAPGVSYVWFPGIDDNQYVYDRILEEDRPEALIVDFRHSHGGAFTYGLTGMGHFTDHEIPVWRSRSRNGPGRSDFDEWLEWTLPAREPYWNGPIVVLVDGESVSATERLILAFRELPNVTVVGVTTNGALATSIPREAPNGWYYQLSVQEVESAHGEVYEGVGIPVDVEMLNDPAVLETGVDQVLEYAISLVTG